MSYIMKHLYFNYLHRSSNNLPDYLRICLNSILGEIRMIYNDLLWFSINIGLYRSITFIHSNLAEEPIKSSLPSLDLKVLVYVRTIKEIDPLHKEKHRVCIKPVDDKWINNWHQVKSFMYFLKSQNVYNVLKQKNMIKYVYLYKYDFF